MLIPYGPASPRCFTLWPATLMLGIVGCSNPSTAGTSASGSASSRPSSLATEAASPPAASASADAGTTAVQEVDDAMFEAVLKDLARQTGGGQRGELGPKGLVLRKLGPEGALFRIGLRDGDVIEKVNGAAFSEPEQIVDATAAVMKARRFDVHANRAGSLLRFIVQATSSAAPTASASASPSVASSAAPGVSSAKPW